MKGDVTLTAAEAEQIGDALWSARSDIWQTARVSEYNLTGNDPSFPEDTPSGRPAVPKLIHRAGLDESYRVFNEVCEASRMLALKRKDLPTTDMEPTPSQDEAQQQAPTLSEVMAPFKRPGSHRLWSFDGPSLSTVLRERHDVGCECSYCRTFAANGRGGIQLPACKAANAWRIIWWRWNGELHIVRWTLPKRKEGGA